MAATRHSCDQTAVARNRAMLDRFTVRVEGDLFIVACPPAMVLEPLLQEHRVRRDDQRELLFELDTARRAIFQRDGKDEVFDLVSRSYTNLLRQWGE